MSLATFSARRVDLVGLLAVLITATALITTLVLLTVAPRAEPGFPALMSVTPTAVWSIAPSDGGDVRGCGNCLVP